VGVVQNQCVKEKQRISTGGGQSLAAENPFEGLAARAFPAGTAAQPAKAAESIGAVKKTARGRLELRRETGGRGGKTVTTLRGEGFLNVCPQQLEDYCKRFKAQAGCGGARKGHELEFQGDCRDRAELFFAEQGFRVVRAGG